MKKIKKMLEEKSSHKNQKLNDFMIQIKETGTYSNLKINNDLNDFDNTINKITSEKNNWFYTDLDRYNHINTDNNTLLVKNVKSYNFCG
jgi:hypothetical protein